MINIFVVFGNYYDNYPSFIKEVFLSKEKALAAIKKYVEDNKEDGIFYTISEYKDIK